MRDALGGFGCVLSAYRAERARKDKEANGGVKMKTDYYIKLLDARRAAILRDRRQEIPQPLWDCFIDHYVKADNTDGEGNFCGKIDPMYHVDNLCMNGDYYLRENEWSDGGLLSSQWDCWGGNWLCWCENAKRNQHIIAFNDDVCVMDWGFAA